MAVKQPKHKHWTCRHIKHQGSLQYEVRDPRGHLVGRWPTLREAEEQLRREAIRRSANPHN